MYSSIIANSITCHSAHQGANCLQAKFTHTNHTIIPQNKPYEFSMYYFLHTVAITLDKPCRRNSTLTHALVTIYLHNQLFSSNSHIALSIDVNSPFFSTYMRYLHEVHFEFLKRHYHTRLDRRKEIPAIHDKPEYPNDVIPDSSPQTGSTKFEVKVGTTFLNTSIQVVFLCLCLWEERRGGRMTERRHRMEKKP